MNNIYEFDKDLCKLFGNRIGLALKRGNVDFLTLYTWYMENRFYIETKKIRGIGTMSRYIMFQYFLQNYRKKAIEVYL